VPHSHLEALGAAVRIGRKGFLLLDSRLSIVDQGQPAGRSSFLSSARAVTSLPSPLGFSHWEALNSPRTAPEMMKPWMRLLAQDAQTFFITIAVLLGTGILGLPVKLVYSGMAPFVVVFTITLLMQLAIIWVSCDLVSIAKQSLPRSDLHTIGRRYLSPVQSICFDLLVLLTFISTLISYALAGSKAFVSLNQIIHPGAGDNSQAIITPFVLACACGVIFLEALLKPAIAAGTAAKVILLIGIVAIVGVVASHVDLSPTTSWNDIMQPYLVGTVAIGGIGNLLPAFFDAYLLTPPVKALEAAEVANNAGTSADGSKKSSTDPNDPANLPKSFYVKAMKHFRSATAAGVIAC
jgi:Transmembrane amino acid transporter protein